MLHRELRAFHGLVVNASTLGTVERHSRELNRDNKKKWSLIRPSIQVITTTERTVNRAPVQMTNSAFREQAEKNDGLWPCSSTLFSSSRVRQQTARFRNHGADGTENKKNRHTCLEELCRAAKRPMW